MVKLLRAELTEHADWNLQSTRRGIARPFVSFTVLAMASLTGCSPERTDTGDYSAHVQSATAEMESTTNRDLQTGYVESDGAELYYQSAGTGPAIILVHGSAGNSDLWEQQAPAFVKAGYQVVAFDLRSAGRSRPEPGQQAAGTIANDIEAIRRALNLDSIYIVGQAQGAEGALEYGLVHSEHVHGIVVAATYRGAEADPAFVALRDKLAPPANFAGRTGIEMRLSAHYIKNNPEGVQRFEEIDALNKTRQSVGGKLDGKRLTASIQSAGIPLDYARLSEISVPTLVLSAERDDITPPALMSELARHIPGAHYATVPNAGRYAFWENPEAFNQIVLDFMNDAEAAQQLDIAAPGGYFEVSGGRVWYRDTGGDGEPILLLHPFTGTDEVWKHQLIEFAQRGLRVVAFSRRGAGRSGDLPEPDASTSDDISALLDHLELPKAHLVGAAAGGVHALSYAIDEPGRVLSLTLSNSLAGIGAEEVTNLQGEFMPPPSLSAHLKELGPSYRFTNPEGVRDWLDIKNQSISEKFKSLSSEDRQRRYAAILKGFADSVDIEALTIPVLLVYGGADLYAPPAIGRKIQKRFNNASLIVVPEAGHAVHWENPEEFNRIVLDFVQSNVVTSEKAE